MSEQLTPTEREKMQIALEAAKNREGARRRSDGRYVQDFSYELAWAECLAARDAVVERPDENLRAAAERVVSNAYGTKPRHTQAREGGCRDDCIPCGIDALREALAVAARLPERPDEGQRERNRLIFWIEVLKRETSLEHRDNDEQVEVEGRLLHNLTQAGGCFARASPTTLDAGGPQPGK